jgi:F-type H+-transporting ATPase subunit b
MPQLQQADLFLSQIFWLVLTFVLVYFFVARYFMPRIAKVVDNREAEVKRNLAEAESLLAEHKSIKAEMEQILATARQEGAAMRNIATEKAEDFMQDQIKKFEKNLTKKVAAEDERLARLKHQLEKDVSTYSDTLAKEIVKVILPANLNIKV